MRSLGYLAAFSALVSGVAASAQSASQAFECTLPYAEAMQSLATLEVLSQKSSPGLSILQEGPYETIEFAPDSIQVFGRTPNGISLIAREPAANAREKVYKMTFKTDLPVDPELNDHIIASQSWHLGACAFGLCIRDRAADPAGAGSLHYTRFEYEDEDGYEDEDFYGWLPSKIECIFEFTEEELNALGG